MSLLRACLSAVAVSALTATGVMAMPFTAKVGSEGLSATTIEYGYGPRRYGLYGRWRSHTRRSYGTGYHGRGTRTGGPAGGLPGRS